MTEQIPETCSMFGAFNLRPEYDLATFRTAFEAFCDHLEEAGHLYSYRLWKRAYHEGYDARVPEVSVFLEMCFRSYQASLDAWKYVESHVEPLKTLHMAMNKQVKDAHFVLLHEVKSDIPSERQI